MKKALIMLMVVGLMTMLFVPMAMADDPTSGNQIMDGDVPAAFTLTVSGPISGASFNPATSPYTNTATSITCSSNVAYEIQVNCDSDANKTAARLSEWITATGYKESGEAFTAALTVEKQSASGDPTSIAVAAAAVNGMDNLAKGVADNHVLAYSQALDYTDVPATTTYTYHQVMTYTIMANI